MIKYTIKEGPNSGGYLIDAMAVVTHNEPSRGRYIY